MNKLKLIQSKNIGGLVEEISILEQDNEIIQFQYVKNTQFNMICLCRKLTESEND